MISKGDLAALQGGTMFRQGQRETIARTQAGERIEVFKFNFEAGVIPADGGTGGPGDPFTYPTLSSDIVSVINALVVCRFAVAFSDEPTVRVGLALSDEMSWGNGGPLGSGRENESGVPYLTACVVNWHRLKGHRMFVGAHVSVRQYDAPVRPAHDVMKMKARVTFSGPAMATPFNGMDTYENTTDGPDWDLP